MARRPKPWFRPSRGVWYVTYHGRQHNLGSGSEQEAEDRFYELRQRLKEEESKQIPTDAAVSVMDQYLAWCAKHRAPRTYDWYLERLQPFAKHIGTLPLSKLRAYHLQEYLDQHDWGDGHTRGVIVAIQRAFRWAYKLGKIDTFPLRGIEKPAAGKREKIVTPEEFEELLQHVKGDAFRDLLIVSWEIGCRPQESLRVEARHVELAKRRWVIPAREAKGKKRIRIVYLTDRALEICQKLAEKNPVGPIFRNRDGNPWKPYAVNNRFERLKKKIGRKIALYDIRHSYCTRALKNGVDPITLANLMGHVDTAMISRIYSHLSQDQNFMHQQAMKAAQ